MHWNSEITLFRYSFIYSRRRCSVFGIRDAPATAINSQKKKRNNETARNKRIVKKKIFMNQENKKRR